jgi:hypothetical protein
MNSYVNIATIRTQEWARRLICLSAIVVGVLISAPADAITAYGGRLNYGLSWFYLNGTKEVKVDALDGNWKPAAGIPTAAYDPSHNTIIYFHGWQPNAQGVRETFNWERPGTDPRWDGLPIETLTAWKNLGWNVGIFDWNQFADEGTWGAGPFTIPVVVSDAEAKIWSSNGPQKLRFRYKVDGKTSYTYSPTNVTPANLGLPGLIPGNPAWGNTGEGAEVDAAIQFMYGHLPENHPSLADDLHRLHGRKTCLQFVEAVARRLAPQDGTHNDWQEGFVSKICGMPSVGDMAVLTMYRALANQSGKIRFVGHSLGHQLATRTALHLYLAYDQYPSAAMKRFLPERTELLDPYATTASRSYFGTGFSAATGNSGAAGSALTRIFEYHKRIRQIADKRGVDFEAVYLVSSALSSTPGTDSNFELMKIIPTERLYFNYMRGWNPANQGTRHVFGRHWYLATRSSVRPTTNQAVNGGFFGYALSPGADNSYLKEVRTRGVHFAQSRGQYTPTPDDDQFAVCSKSDANQFGKKDFSCGQNGRLHISADNQIEVWSNGVKLNLPNANDWSKADDVAITNFKDGENVIAVRAKDVGGIASLLAKVDPGVGSSLVLSDKNWKVRLVSSGIPAGWNTASFDDCLWQRATVTGAYGIAPWATGVSFHGGVRDAQWIWSSDPNNDNDILLRLNIYQTRENGEIKWLTSYCQ